MPNGTIVNLEPRTLPGIDKPSGVRRILRARNNVNDNTFEYDVSFDLGWREVGVEELCTKIKKSEEW